jgi:hypothetical protein
MVNSGRQGARNVGSIPTLVSNLKITIMNEDQFHELARLFMYQFPDLEELSLDEFLMEYREELTDEQYQLGNFIYSLFFNF